MSLERSILLVVGIIVLGSVMLGVYVNANWFWLTGIMGAHLIQASFTGLCPVVVFMKGNKLMPQCGFSNNVVQILNALAVPFETFDVLSDPEVRQGIKEFSDWPTIPQVYVNGEFMGGSDILIEMYNSGELKEKLEVALAS